MYIIVLFNLRSKALRDMYIARIRALYKFVCHYYHHYYLCLCRPTTSLVTSTETSTLPFPVMHLTVVFQVNLERSSVVNQFPCRCKMWAEMACGSSYVTSGWVHSASCRCRGASLLVVAIAKQNLLFSYYFNK